MSRFGPRRSALSQGTTAYQSTVRALGEKVSALPFSHGGRQKAGPLTLFSSYHCSRYNTNTGRLTEAMFTQVFAEIRAFLDENRPR